MKRFFAGALFLTLPFAGALSEKAYAEPAVESSEEEPEAEGSAQTLDSIEVTAYKFGVDSLSVPVYSTTIDKEQIEESSYPKFCKRRATSALCPTRATTPKAAFQCAALAKIRRREF